ncbi:MAG TPA: gamma-glutamyl-gamma-aminobutyrate hydrolase family protein [Actinomycetota bacterium]|nr:gamma-glutamyl-gamma-aminobutyrate hydrolase family protein [Actinomycetota bacterium]
MRRPRVIVVGHGRDIDSVLGTHRACVVGEPYLRALDRAGALPVIAWAGSRNAGEFLELGDAVVLLGGGDVDPRRFHSKEQGEAVDLVRDEFEFGLVRSARDAGVPLLGMCRGAQAMNVALGGTLRRVEDHRQGPALTEPSHSLVVAEGSRLEGLLHTTDLEVNSFHRWAVDRPAEGFRVTAVAPDGATEGVESESDWWAAGIQWHAEWLSESQTVALFEALLSGVKGGVAR